jgi:hypothetical protein
MPAILLKEIEMKPYTPSPIDDSTPVLRITMEQRGCLVEVCVPEAALPSALEMKEYMKNTGADMYARMYHMMQQMERADK